jgi:hypothetical protein
MRQRFKPIYSLHNGAFLSVTWKMKNGDMVLSRLRSGLPTHLCSLSFKGQALPDSICLHM